MPFLITASAAEHGSARQALERGAFDLIPTPPNPEQAVQTIQLALWHNKLKTLIAQKEMAMTKYRHHMAAYPDDQRQGTHLGVPWHTWKHRSLE